MKVIIFSLITLMVSMCGGKNTPVEYEKAEFTSKEGHVLPYRILFPENYSKKEDYPLLIFMHGSGERGNDNMKHLVHIAPKFKEADFRKKHPAIIVFPQCAAEDTWSPVEIVDGDWFVGQAQNATPSMVALTELIDQLIIDYPVQRDRIYAGGLSMGGFGTFELLHRMPYTFAAAIPICGGGNRRFVHEYKEIPFWIFHGAKDTVVPVSLSREMVTEFRGRGMDFKYTEYPQGEHNVWNKAWEEPDLIPWLFKQKRVTRE